MMKSLYFLAFLLGGFMTSTLSAKQIGMNISYAQFMNEEGKAYVEIYFALAGNSIDFAMVNNKEYKGGVQVTVKVLKDSTTIHQKSTKTLPRNMETVHTDLANLEDAVRKLGGQNGNNGTSGTLAPTTVVWAKNEAQTIWNRKRYFEAININSFNRPKHLILIE